MPEVRQDRLGRLWPARRRCDAFGARIAAMYLRGWFRSAIPRPCGEVLVAPVTTRGV